MRIWLIGALVALAILATVIGRTAHERGWGNYLRLIQDGSRAPGVITGIDTHGACRADYTFTAGGRNYSGSSAFCGVRVGQQVIITYLPDDPSLSCLGSPADRLAKEIISSLLGRISFPELP